MALTEAERHATAAELCSNYRAAGEPVDQICADLAITPQQLERILAMQSGIDPVTVWRLRDYLDHLITALGDDPVPYSVLTERARSLAAMWFPLHPAPGPSSTGLT